MPQYRLFNKIAFATSVLKSESGSFYVDKNGVVQRFEPAQDNPFVEEETELNDNYTSGWFPTLSGTTMKYQKNMEARLEYDNFNISMNQNDLLLIIAGHTAARPNEKVTYTCTIKLS